MEARNSFAYGEHYQYIMCIAVDQDSSLSTIQVALTALCGLQANSLERRCQVKI